MGIQAVVRTALVGRRRLSLEGIASTIANSRYALVLRCEDAVEFRYHAQTTPLALCLAVSPTDDLQCFARDIADSRADHPDLCLVALSSADEHRDSLVAAGADGHLSIDASPEALIMALDFFVEGARDRREDPATSDRADLASAQPFASRGTAAGDLFSLPEWNVIAGIARGESNKYVARRLCVSEATVKAHVRAILKKTGAANRTQVAIWRTQNQPGLAGDPGQGVAQAQLEAR